MIDCLINKYTIIIILRRMIWRKPVKKVIDLLLKIRYNLRQTVYLNICTVCRLYLRVI